MHKFNTGGHSEKWLFGTRTGIKDRRRRIDFLPIVSDLQKSIRRVTLESLSFYMDLTLCVFIRCGKYISMEYRNIDISHLIPNRVSCIRIIV